MGAQDWTAQKITSQKGGVAMDRCNMCFQEMPKVERQRKRSRRCKKCVSNVHAETRKKDYLKVIQNRWRSKLAKHRIYKTHVVDYTVVKDVVEKYNRRSMISGEKDPSLLTITSRSGLEDGIEPTIDDLILVTSKEAEKLAKAKNKKERSALLEKRTGKE